LHCYERYISIIACKGLMSKTPNGKGEAMTAATTGWKKAKRTSSRKPSDAKLAKDIVASIRAHADAGVIRTAADYSSRLEVIEAVEAILGT
jgi:hypothetical protein